MKHQKVILLIVASLFLLQNDVISCEVIQHNYCIVGAGPAGLQLAYFLNSSNRDYVLLERNNISGSFFNYFPRHRRLISLNKKHTGELNKEFNLRHDWNSLLTNKEEYNNYFRFTSYSNDNFPNADFLVEYLKDFKIKYNLNVKYNTEIKQINCIRDINKAVCTNSFSSSSKKDCKFELIDQNLNKLQCKVLIVTTGLNSPNIPQNLKNIDGYETVSTNPKDYEAKTVLILGKGNAAFEMAQSIYGYTNLIHMVSRSRLRNAFSTHYVGDVRALNNEVLDTYQLKSLDGLLEFDLNDVELVKVGDKFYISAKNDSNIEISPAMSRIGYDKVIRCLGFKFDFDIFNSTLKFTKPNGRAKKYPKIDGSFESVDYKNLYFGGTASHSLDFRKSSGGFIHGFRYNARALYRVLEKRFHGIKWPLKLINLENMLNYLLKRINEASGPYQMFGRLVDIILIRDDLKVEYLEEYPILMLNELGEMTGKKIKSFVIVNYQYGSEFSGPGKDVFNLDRVTSYPEIAHKSNFLHPVLYYYSKFPKLDKSFQDQTKAIEKILQRADKVHHMLEDFLSFWTSSIEHQLHLRRFFEFILNKNLKRISMKHCLYLHAKYGSAPLTCKLYFKK